MAQVVGNLLNNAAKYTDEGGRILLKAWRQDGHAIISVRDTGVGIAPEMLPRVFELFALADRSLDRSQGVLGIGLTMVKRLIELHGGSVDVCSEGLGLGSIFVVRLPALSQEVCAGEHKPATPGKHPGQSSLFWVLVVDDVTNSAASLAELLELWGHPVRTARDGPTALTIAREFQPEVVLLDIGMPGMNGFDVARALRAEHGSGMQLVAMTGYGQIQDREATYESGFDHHLVKPVDLDSLRKFLDSPWRV
jgi:CheY-like chemotaxis protein